MAKARTVFFCQNCGYESGKWMGKCPSCNQWNTFVEEVIQRDAPVPLWKKGGESEAFSTSAGAELLEEINYRPEFRLLTGDAEFNRVLGGGVVPGSLTLIGGEPGIGKSTLMLQLAMTIPELKVLYVSGEESKQQIKMRASRIGSPIPGNCYILTETSINAVFKQINELKPQLLVIDSIQTLSSQQVESAPGSVSQVRECTAELMRYAKSSSTPVFIIGHITKDGSIAGPKILEHMVDTVLQFEGDRHHLYRILRSVKNRFGSASELGIYEMFGQGLRQVANPSGILLSQHQETLSGVAVAAMIEGARPLLIEVQALVGSAAYGTPQRSATGFDTRRMNMLLAVLEKRFGFRLSSLDVFLNMAGGIRVEDPAIDLAIVAALISSQQDIPLPANITFAGEVGLSGEIRPVTRIEQRIAESEKLGFETIYLSSYNQQGIQKQNDRLTLHFCANINELFQALFA